MQVLYPRCCGLDVHKQTVVACLRLALDGKVVKEGDDLMAATRYGIMMLRFASTKAAYDKFRRPIEYPKVKYV